MRGVVIHDETRGRLDAQAVGNGKGQCRLRDHDVGKPAEHREGHDPVPRVESRPPGCRADAAGDFDSRDEWQRRLHLILATGEQEVGEAHARGRDLDNDAFGVLRFVDLDQMETGRALEALDLLRAHLIPPSR